MKQSFAFKIGKVYIGSTDPFEVITVGAYNTKEALNIAVNYLKPNHLQTLTIVNKQPVKAN